MELFVVAIVCIALLICLILNMPIIYALVFGLFVFISYALKKGFKLDEVLKMALKGATKVFGVLVILTLVGMLTALWRASGTIPLIVSYASMLIYPPIFLLLAFLACCAVSVLIGSSLGTAATMGVVLMGMSNALNLNPAFSGGAILAGCYFGDRMSFVSSVALLVSSVTKTDLYTNVRLMFKTAIVPLILSCIFYLVLGLFIHPQSIDNNIFTTFEKVYNMSALAIIPALSIVVLALFKIKVKTTMLVSIILAFILCIFLQNINIDQVIKIMIFGFESHNATISSMVDGGGIISMLDVILIITVSASYTEIFEETKLLEGMKQRIYNLAFKITPVGSVIVTAIVSTMIACNQALSIIVTNQLTSDLFDDNQDFTIVLEDTVVVIAPLIPWCVASTVPLNSINAPTSSILFAIFLFLMPIFSWLRHLKTQPKPKQRQVE